MNISSAILNLSNRLKAPSIVKRTINGMERTWVNGKLLELKEIRPDGSQYSLRRLYDTCGGGCVLESQEKIGKEITKVRTRYSTNKDPEILRIERSLGSEPVERISKLGNGTYAYNKSLSNFPEKKYLPSSVGDFWVEVKDLLLRKY